MRENQFQSRQTGAMESFKTLPLILNDGINTIYVEALQERAQQILDMNLKEGEVVNVQLSFNARSYKASNGDEKWSTDIIVQKLGRLF